MDLKGFGIDGELGLNSAVLNVINNLPSPVHVRCYRHVKDNFKESMKGKPIPVSWEYDILDWTVKCI